MSRSPGKTLIVGITAGVAAAVVLLLIGSASGFIAATMIVNGISPSFPALQIAASAIGIAILAALAWAVYRVTGAVWGAVLAVAIAGGSNIALVAYIVVVDMLLVS